MYIKASLLTYVLILFSCISSQALADTDGFYLGLGYAGGNGKKQLEDTEAKFYAENTRLTLGFVKEDNKRAEISRTSENIKFDRGGEEKVRLWDLDLVFPYTDFWIQPFFSIGFGLASYKDLDKSPFVYEEELQGYSYQIGLGTLVSITEYIELDVGTKYRSIGWKGSDEDDANEVTSFETKLSQLTFKVNCLF